ncbi:MAG TPA: homoserine O-acetyltransferase [Acidothermaceae bacterium]
MPDGGDLIPASGGWREGDHPGDRRFAELGAFDLELGGQLPDVRVAYETWGELNADASNAVLVLHALTGDSHVVGAAGPGHATAGWWDGLIGADAPIDSRKWFVVAPNVLGGCQGSTGPSSLRTDGDPSRRTGGNRQWGSAFPRTTVRDQVTVEAALADRLGISRWASLVGGSMGAMRVLEWLVEYPSRTSSALVLAVGATATGDQIGTQSAQLRAITSDPRWRGGDYYDAADGEGPHEGMGLARRIAHLTYRSADELQVRFGNEPQDGEDPLRDGRFAVQSYLDYQAVKLARRFDAGTYVALTDAMNTHDVGRGRGGVTAALSSITAPVIVAGVDSDRLYPLVLQRALAAGIPTTVGGLRIVHSDVGHDGFLIERDAVGALVRETLAVADRVLAGSR